MSRTFQTPPLAAGTWLALLALAGAMPYGAHAADAAPPRVPSIVVQTGAAHGGFEIEATIQAVQQSTVAAQAAGNVTALAVKAGDRVKAGQLLARIDERDAQAGLAQRDAALAQADAELRNARANATRTRELRAQNFVSQAALDVAQTQLEAAQAATQQAQAARAQAVLARGFAHVTAPFDALVLATHLEAGELATPGRPIATLYAPGRMRAVLQLPASRAAAARAAAKVEVQTADGRWWAPAARTELPGADPVTQTIEWRLELPKAAASSLLPGQSARVRFAAVPAVPAAQASLPARLSVPSAAVLRRGELNAVYAVQDGRFVLKPIRLGAVQADSVEVLAGLKAGERIALDPVRAGLAGAMPH